MKNSIRFAILMAAVIGFGAMSTSVEAAARDLQVRTRAVHYADLNLSNAEGAATLLARIRSAAYVVCYSASDSALGTFSEERACRQQAIAHAVAVVNSPVLEALYTSINEKRVKDSELREVAKR